MTRANAQPQLVVRPVPVPGSGRRFGLYLKVRGRLVELLVGTSECLSGARGIAAYQAALTLDPVISTEGL